MSIKASIKFWDCNCGKSHSWGVLECPYCGNGRNGMQLGKPLIEVFAKESIIVSNLLATTDELKLNKLERAWYLVIQQRHKFCKPHCMKFKLADGCIYFPDFICSDDDKLLTAYETKGPHRFREKGIIKLKVAAREFPMVNFVLVTRDKITHEWIEKTVKP